MVTRRKQLVLLAVLVLILSLALMAAAPGRGGKVVRYSTDLTGAAEVPGPGDSDGVGLAVITIRPKGAEVCWNLKVARITLPATAAHIHVGDKNTAGPVVVPLSAPDENGRASGCTTVEKELLRNLLKTPENYYVNVHNADFPAGALRGQLP
jgi:hypothetical protein